MKNSIIYFSLKTYNLNILYITIYLKLKKYFIPPMTKVLICSVIKDVAHRIVSNIERAHTFGQYFPYKILLYENNSTDTTKQALATLSSHPNIKVIMETLSYTKDTSKVWAYTKITQSDHPCRIEQIANARNQLVHELNHPQYDDYDVVVWIDMDAEDFDVPSIVDSIHQVQQKNIVLFANSPAYYDYYALRCHNFQCTNLFGPELNRVIGKYLVTS